MEDSIKNLEVEDDEDEPSYRKSQHVKNLMVCSEKLDCKERGKISQINGSSCLSNSEISCQEKGLCLLDPAGGKNNISTQVYKDGKVLDSEILKERVDISLEGNHDNPFHSSFENQSDGMLEELHSKELCHDK